MAAEEVVLPQLAVDHQVLVVEETAAAAAAAVVPQHLLGADDLVVVRSLPHHQTDDKQLHPLQISRFYYGVDGSNEAQMHCWE